jgi:hypothetical protein
VEPALLDAEIRGPAPVRERDRHRVERLPERTARVLAGQGDRALAFVRQEGRDEDERLDVAESRRGVADDRAAVGVADQDDRTVDGRQELPDVFAVPGQPAQRVARGHHRVAV